MIFDTDVLIWALRGNKKAAAELDRAENLHLSVVSYLELLNGARNKSELSIIKKFLVDLDLRLLPLTENIGHRAIVHVEQLALKNSLGLADALIAATAEENSLPLCTANTKHFRQIEGLDLKVFRP